MRAALYNLAPKEYLHHTSIVFLALPSLLDASQPTMASATKIPARPAVAMPRLLAEPTEDAILVTLELAELDALEWDISWAETLLNEHNTRMHAGPAGLLFCQLSTPDSRGLIHLDVSHWQGYVSASVRRFFINPQGDLYLTKDGIQYIVDQLGILRRLIPLIQRDFATAARNADQMGARAQETMDLILAHERELQQNRHASATQGFTAGMRSIAMRTVPAPLRPPCQDRVWWGHINQWKPSLPPPLLARASSLVRLRQPRKES